MTKENSHESLSYGARINGPVVYDVRNRLRFDYAIERSKSVRRSFVKIVTRIGTLRFERGTRPTIPHRRFMTRWTSNALAVFVICCTSRAIAQTTTNQPPASSAQGATPSNAPAQSLEQEINSEVAEAGNGKASLTEVNKELSNPISTI